MLKLLASGLTARSALAKFAAVQMVDVHLPMGIASPASCDIGGLEVRTIAWGSFTAIFWREHPSVMPTCRCRWR
jgi:hypothetical protein